MKNLLKVKKCMKCGATVIVKEDCNCGDCGIQCCGEQMAELVPNTVEASLEKHIPNYELIENDVLVTLNHPMDKDHYIQWIALVKENRVQVIDLYPEGDAIARFPYIPNSTIYAMCNKHQLWSKDVD